MPHVTPNLETRTDIMQKIADKVKIDIPYRANYLESTELTGNTSSMDWRVTTQSGNVSPRWIVIGFQTARHDSQEKNNGVFDHLSANKVFVKLILEE